MRRNQITALASFALVTVLANVLLADPEPEAPKIAAEELAPEPEVAAPDAEVGALIKQLSDDEFGMREGAMSKLWKMGDTALPALRNLAESKDPEAVGRASELILYIAAGVLHDSPADIKEMVMEYSRTTLDKKLTILRKLTERGHWRQVMHLANLEKDEGVRKKVFEIVQKNAGDAARKAIVAGNLDLVGEIIGLLGNSDQALVMRAWYYKQRGNLPAQLEAAAKMPGKEGTRWRLALHRADGNLAGALAEAKVLGDAKLVAALQLLLGDPIPWLLADTPAQRRLDPILDRARRIQVARLRGEDKKAQSLALELIPMARSTGTNQRVITALAGTGFRDHALDVMSRREPLSAFAYYDNMEAPGRALELIGIPREARPPYTDWVKKTTDQALEDEEYSGYTRLIMLASFLVRHGENEHAMPTVKPMMDALQKDGADVWFDLIYTMARFDLAKEALILIEKRGNEDMEADKAIKKIFRSVSENSVVHLWEALKKRNNLKLDQSLQQIAILSGLMADTDNEIPELQKALIAEAKEDNDIDDTARFTAVFAFAMTRGDMETCLAMSAQKVPDEKWVRAKQYYEKELFQWQDMEAYYADKVKKDPGDYRSAVYYYVVLRKLGKKDKTEGMLERIMLLSMGDPGVLSSIGSELYKVGYYKEATDLWLQTLLMAEPGDSHFDTAIESLTEYPQHLYDSGQWKTSAAIAEASVWLLTRGDGGASINDMLRARFKVEFARGMDLLKNGKREQALTTLDTARKLVPGDGTLADHFFPTLLKAGVGKTYEKWFEESYSHVSKAGSRYPNSHNTHNTAAWLCSRAVRKLDAAEQHSKAALKERPHQGAYLDTMAEVWFAKGDRAKAIEWSRTAVKASRSKPQSAFRDRTYVFLNFQQLQLQLDRFQKAPLPKVNP